MHAHVHVHVHACISRALHVHAAHMCSEAEAEGERGWFIIRSLVPFSNKKRVRVTVSGRASLGCVLRFYTVSATALLYRVETRVKNTATALSFQPRPSGLFVCFSSFKLELSTLPIFDLGQLTSRGHLTVSWILSWSSLGHPLHFQLPAGPSSNLTAGRQLKVQRMAHQVRQHTKWRGQAHRNTIPRVASRHRRGRIRPLLPPRVIFGQGPSRLVASMLSTLLAK